MVTNDLLSCVLPVEGFPEINSRTFRPLTVKMRRKTLGRTPSGVRLSLAQRERGSDERQHSQAEPIEASIPGGRGIPSPPFVSAPQYPRSSPRGVADRSRYRVGSSAMPRSTALCLPVGDRLPARAKDRLQNRTG